MGHTTNWLSLSLELTLKTRLLRQPLLARHLTRLRWHTRLSRHWWHLTGLWRHTWLLWHTRLL